MPSARTRHVTGSKEKQVLDLPKLLPKRQWRVYRHVLRSAVGSGIPFALGGAVALGAYTGKFRNTKDIDLYVLPEDRERMIALLTAAGLRDYYSAAPYDREWIYRGTDGHAIVDVIWAMANKRASVDAEWISRAQEVLLDGMTMRILAPEELIWSKLYVMQRERCDWPDILNLLNATRSSVDWEHLKRRVGDDAPLLNGVVSVFSWLSQDSARTEPQRANLLDSRPWFHGLAGANSLPAGSCQ